MRLLFVTFFFPPFRSSGAVRTGQTASHLASLGHDVRVVTADLQSTDCDLTVGLPRERITYTPWLGASLFAAMSGRRPHRADGTALRGEVGEGAALPVALKTGVRFAQKNLLYVPDDCIGWYPWAVAASLRTIRAFDPDLIYASAGPATGLLAAATVARIAGRPWVAELRDLWSDNHYREYASWLQPLDARLERTVLSSAAGLVTMSVPWASLLQRRYGVPVEVVYNGYEERVLDERRPTSAPGEPLILAHLGSLYGGRRDPTPLFRAIAMLKEQAASVRAEFYGAEQDLVRALARAEGVEGSVRAFPEIPYAESLKVQARADALLLIMYDRPEEKGVLPGKLFEYFGARRPLLVIGGEGGAAADLVSGRNLGTVSSGAGILAAQLRTWLREKRDRGGLRPLPEEATADFRRSTQVRILSDFLSSVQRRRSTPRAPDAARRE